MSCMYYAGMYRYVCANVPVSLRRIIRAFVSNATAVSASLVVGVVHQGGNTPFPKTPGPQADFRGRPPGMTDPTDTNSCPMRGLLTSQ